MASQPLHKKEWIKLALMLGILILGTWMNNVMDGVVNVPSHWNNHLHYRNAMCMVIFLWMGDWLKVNKGKVERFYVYAVLFYMAAIIAGLLTGHYVPSYTHDSDVTFMRLPLYLYYAMFGSISIVLISMKIDNSKVLEYYGRGSLVAYMSQFFFLSVSIRILSRYIFVNNLLSAAYFTIMVFVIVSISCAAMIWIFQLPYLRKLIGK